MEGQGGREGGKEGGREGGRERSDHVSYEKRYVIDSASIYSEK